jgi:hypothetical protein
LGLREPAFSQGQAPQRDQTILQALREALADATQLRLIEAVIPRDDISPMLSALTAELGKRVARQG